MGIVKEKSSEILELSGNIFNDGNSDGSVNGVPISSVSSEQLYVTLIDSSGVIVASKPVDENGRYRFTTKDGLKPNSKYKIVLGIKPNTTTPKLPENWSNTGEKESNNGVGDDGKADGILEVTIKDSSIENNDFGINEKPKGEDYIVDKKKPIVNEPNKKYPVDLNLTDREDKTPKRVIIQTIPDLSSGTLYYGGKPVQAGEIIENFDTTKLTIDPQDGNQTVEFSYTVVDSAGVESDPYQVRIPFIGDSREEAPKEIKLGDYVWYDKNLNGVQDKGEAGVVGIKVVLLNEDGTPAIGTDGKPIESVTDKNGYYLLQHVKPGFNYKVKFDIPESYLPTLQNQGSDLKDSDADSNGIIHVVRPLQDNMTLDLGIYCECDDYEVHPERYKELKASTLSIAGLLIMLTALFIVVRKH